MIKSHKMQGIAY